MKESVDKDIDIPSADHDNQPIEIEEEEEATQETPPTKRKGKQVANNYSRRAECWNHFIEIKENGKRMVGKSKYCDVVYKADPNMNRIKNLKNHFAKFSKNQTIKASTSPVDF